MVTRTHTHTVLLTQTCVSKGTGPATAVDADKLSLSFQETYSCEGTPNQQLDKEKFMLMLMLSGINPSRLGADGAHAKKGQAELCQRPTKKEVNSDTAGTNQPSPYKSAYYALLADC